MLLTVVALAVAVPGPDSTAVIAAARDPDSVAIAARYAAVRGIPDAQVCAIDPPLTEDVSLADFDAQVRRAIDDCLEQRGVADRIEALVLTRGLPLRVAIPIAGGRARVSMAAALALGSTATSTGAPLLGRSPGRSVACGGSTCFAARWSNPFRSGVFRAGWTARSGGFEWHPRIVTMLHGRSTADALRLVASATTADARGGERGTFLFMDGADPARAALDPTYDAVIAALRDHGFTDVERVPFAVNLRGRSLAALFVGTAGLGATIEDNRYAPGALVDNLTSFGAVAENFRASGEESQVSIARWVARGVAGVHGTTDEPLNNCFPDRSLITAYVEGGTLGEAYFRALPYAYWQNLVLGDPMTAPYATRPEVVIDGLVEGEEVRGARAISVSARDPLGRTIDHLTLYVDGRAQLDSGGDPIELCLEPGARHVLAVAQISDERTPETRHRTKGWASVRVTAAPGAPDCRAEPVDAGSPLDAGTPGPDASAGTPSPDASAAVDASPDAGAGPDDAAAAAPPPEAGCDCATTDRSAPLGVIWIALAWGAHRRRRRDRRAT